MDINLMVLGLGNTRLSIGVFSAGELTHVTRLSLEDRADWTGKIADAWGRIREAQGRRWRGLR